MGGCASKQAAASVELPTLVMPPAAVVLPTPAAVTTPRSAAEREAASDATAATLVAPTADAVDAPSQPSLAGSGGAPPPGEGIDATTRASTGDAAQQPGGGAPPVLSPAAAAAAAAAVPLSECTAPDGGDAASASDADVRGALRQPLSLRRDRSPHVEEEQEAAALGAVQLVEIGGTELGNRVAATVIADDLVEDDGTFRAPAQGEWCRHCRCEGSPERAHALPTVGVALGPRTPPSAALLKLFDDDQDGLLTGEETLRMLRTFAERECAGCSSASQPAGLLAPHNGCTAHSTSPTPSTPLVSTRAAMVRHARAQLEGDDLDPAATSDEIDEAVATLQGSLLRLAQAIAPAAGGVNVDVIEAWLEEIDVHDDAEGAEQGDFRSIAGSSAGGEVLFPSPARAALDG